MQGAAGLFSGSGGAATYSGASQYMTVPHNAALKPTAAITLESWFVIDDLSQWRGIISTTQSGGWALDYTGAGSGSALRCNLRRNGAYGTAQIANVIEVGKVYHAVATYDGRFVRLYLGSLTEDTVEVAVNDAGANYPIQYANNNAICIGCEASAGSSPEGQYWDGILDETAIYGTALSAARILLHNRVARGL
ncbi:Concanavalin A-like lectin/glucanases superfamily protein [compost metagenome]